jgi:hypothetical protein
VLPTYDATSSSSEVVFVSCQPVMPHPHLLMMNLWIANILCRIHNHLRQYLRTASLLCRILTFWGSIYELPNCFAASSSTEAVFMNCQIVIPHPHLMRQYFWRFCYTVYNSPRFNGFINCTLWSIIVVITLGKCAHRTPSGVRERHKCIGLI